MMFETAVGIVRKKSHLRVAQCFVFLLLTFCQPVFAAPGDILYQNIFSNNGAVNSDWSRNGGNGNDLRANTATFSSSPRSMRIRDGVEATSNNGLIDASVSAADVSFWLRQGSPGNAPETGDDLEFFYQNNVGSWIPLAGYSGADSAGTIYNVSFSLPAAALHNNLRFRFDMIAGDDNDRWYVDDFTVTERAPAETVPPIASDDSATTFTGGTESIDLAANDSDVDSGLNLASIQIVGGPSNGNVTVNGDGTVSYTHNGGSTTSDSFTYTIDDNAGNSSNTATVSISISTLSCGTYRDTFGSTAYNNSNGSIDWSTEFWLEANETGNGDVRITAGELRLRGNDTTVSGNETSIAREIDLTGYNTATLTFDYDTSAPVEGDDAIIVEISSNGGTSYTQLDRFQGEVSGSASYDISADISSQLRIRFRFPPEGNNGACCYGVSDEFFYVDNFEVEACRISVVDHYVISAASPTVTCEAVDVIVSAVDGGGSAIDIPGGTTLTLSTDLANDGWTNPASVASNQYTLPSDSANVTFQLRKLTPATLEIDVDGSGGATDDDGNRNDDFVDFVDAAFRFYSNSVIDNIGTQISGKDSDVAPANTTLSIRAIQTDPTTGRCEALINGGNVNIGLAYECNNPTSCALTNHLTLGGMSLNGTNDGAVPSYTNVTLNFDANGTADFVMSYADAGRISLHARADLSVDSSTVTVQGNSNDFVVRPAGLCVASGDANASCGIPDHTCSVLQLAGDTFPLTVSARVWNGAGQTNTEFCANDVTPNFVFSSIPLAHNLIEPSSGSLGSVSLTAASIVTGGTVTVSQSVSEVGVFTFNAGAIENYLGETDADISQSTSSVIGRFIPAQFSIKNPLLTETNGSFSYLLQPFDVSFELNAENSSGDLTENYTDVFAKIGNDSTHLSYDGLLGVVPVVFDEMRISAIGTVIVWNDGVGSTTTALQIDRSLGLQAPLENLAIGVRVDEQEDSYNLDTVGVNLDTDLSGLPFDVTDDHVELGITTQRFGRLYSTDVWGPESAGLSVPLQVQYWNGSVWLLSNGDETQIPRSDIEFIDSGGSALSMTSDPVTAPVGSNPNVIFNYDPTGNATLDFGDGLGGGTGDSGMFVGAPGAQGFFRVDVDLTNFPWLQFDWDQDGDNNDADDFDLPRFTVTFESYRGHDRVIYWREVLSPL